MRRATSTWSRPKGTANTGTPAERAFWTRPMPPGQTTQAALAIKGPWAAKRTTRALGGGEKASGSTEAVVTRTRTFSRARPSRTSLIRRPSFWNSVLQLTSTSGRESSSRSRSSGKGSQLPGPTRRTESGHGRGYSNGSAVKYSSRGGVVGQSSRRARGGAPKDSRKAFNWGRAWS